MTAVDPLDVTLQVVEVLEDLGARYVIVGSMASIVHGMIRSTMDADVLTELEPAHIPQLVSALQERFHIDALAIREAIDNRRSFSLIHLATMFKVDVFISRQRPFDEQQLTRRAIAQVRSGSDRGVWVLSPEDVILAKLDWFRLGGQVSERQWRDILGVLLSQRDKLDTAYLKEWSAALGVSDLLDRAFKELPANPEQ